MHALGIPEVAEILAPFQRERKKSIFGDALDCALPSMRIPVSRDALSTQGLVEMKQKKKINEDSDGAEKPVVKKNARVRAVK